MKLKITEAHSGYEKSTKVLHKHFEPRLIAFYLLAKWEIGVVTETYPNLNINLI